MGKKGAVLCAESCCGDEINGRGRLVQMEDRGGQGELGRKMKIITVLQPLGGCFGGGGQRLPCMGEIHIRSPFGPLNSERWYQSLLLQTSSLITPPHSLALFHLSMHV